MKKPKTLAFVFQKLILFLLIAEYFRPQNGRQYGVGARDKVHLLFRIRRNSRHPESASSFHDQLSLATAVLQIPASANGFVAEFGCYRGLCTASLSLVCRLVRRQLVVYDSFAGLPDVEEIVDHIDGQGQIKYRKGDYCGSLDQVRGNVRKSGDLSVCDFVVGYFDDTLPKRSPSEKYVLVFEDADLPRSVRTVLREVWPRLQPGCRFFSHEATDLQVVEIFFDREWWLKNLSVTAPGLVGAGCGIHGCLNVSYLGYAIKR